MKKKRTVKKFEQFIPVIVSIGGFLLTFLFLSADLTGDVISNLSQTGYNFLGVVSFLIGLIGLVLYFNQKD